MSTFSIYRLSDGFFTGQQFSMTPYEEARARAHLPEGCAMIKGEHDHLSKRVDLEKMTVMDYQPSQPSPDHEWNNETKRWQLNSVTLATQRSKEQARSRIQQLDSKSTRALRELTLGIVGAQERLQAIEDELQILRKQISGT